MKIKNDSGFTVIELIIAIQLSLLVVGLAYVSYKFSSQLMQNWEEKVAIEAHLLTVSQSLTRVIAQIDQLQLANEQELRAVNASGDSLSIICVDSSLYINDLRVGNNRIKLIKGFIDYYLPAKQVGHYSMPVEQVSLANLKAIDAIKCQLTFQLRDKKHQLAVFSRFTNHPQSIVQ